MKRNASLGGVQHCHENRAIVDRDQSHDIFRRLMGLCNDHGHALNPPVPTEMATSIS